MKKLIAFLLCLMMVFSLFSCNSDKTQNNAQASNSTLTDENILQESGKNDDNNSQPSENDIAMQMYARAINDEICVFDERLGEINLKSLRFPSNNTRLEECKLLTKAILDIDQDGINEYVIQSPNNDYIILRYYNAKVYSYRLDTSDFYNFNTDGTFYWYDSSTAGGWNCGLNKIIFDGETLNIKSIYSLTYSDDPPMYEYYVGGEVVTEDEYYDYRNQNIYKEKLKFSQFELTCSYPISAEQAWNLANAYWDNQDGHTDGAAGTIFTAKIVLIDTPNSDTNYYRVAFQVESTSNVREGGECMPPKVINSYDQILVNAFTGEIIASTYKPDGKGVSIEEAIEIAKNHCEYIDFDNGEKGYRVEHTVNAQAPDHFYVIVIQKYDVDHYSVFDKIWIDKNTGEVRTPFYLNGKG